LEESWMAPLRAAPDASRGVQQIFGGIIAGLEDQGRVNGCPLNNLAVELSGGGVPRSDGGAV
jgi:TetR/AcrR family transcriptional repressor of nem operon